MKKKIYPVCLTDDVESERARIKQMNTMKSENTENEKHKRKKQEQEMHSQTKE